MGIHDTAKANPQREAFDRVKLAAGEGMKVLFDAGEANNPRRHDWCRLKARKPCSIGGCPVCATELGGGKQSFELACAVKRGEEWHDGLWRMSTTTLHRMAEAIPAGTRRVVLDVRREGSTMDDTLYHFTVVRAEAPTNDNDNDTDTDTEGDIPF
jgi:hypothetical protein